MKAKQKKHKKYPLLKDKKRIKNRLISIIALSTSFLVIFYFSDTSFLTAVLPSFIIGSAFGLFVFFMFFYVRLKEKFQQKQARIISSLQDVTRKLKESLELTEDDADLGDFGVIDKSDDASRIISFPECAVIVGKDREDPYIIPYGLENDFHNPESKALLSALSLLKENGMTIRILKPKNGQKAITKKKSDQWKFNQDNLSTLNFPENLISLN